MSQRVLHLVSSLDYRGNVSQLLAVCRGLCDSDLQSDWEFDVAVLGQPNPRQANLDQVHGDCFQLRQRFAFDPISWWRLRSLLSGGKYEVVHTWDAGAAAQLSRSRPSRGSFRHVATFRGGDAIAPLVQTDQIVCWSEYERQLLVDSGIQNAQQLKPATASVSNEQSSIRAELALADDAVLFGAIGRLVPSNNTEWLIWVFDLILTLHPNTYLLIFGDGPLKDHLLRYADRASSLDHVIFLGERDDLPSVLPAIDMVLHGSDTNRLSLVVLEALAAGVTTLVADAPLYAELDDVTTLRKVPRDDRAAWGRVIDEWLKNDDHRDAKSKSTAWETTAQQLVASLTQLYVE